MTGKSLEDLLSAAKPFTRDLVAGTDRHLAEIDALIAANANGWTIQRIAPLERAIMRVALFEIAHREEIPMPVSIDEAVSTTRRYCAVEAPGFVNGVLSAAARELQAEGTEA